MSRKRINLNREWKFLRGDAPGAERTDFDDSQWQSIGLPHAFDLPYFRTPEFYVGVGWYRKCVRDTGFQPVPSASERRVALDFDGAFQVAEIFVNGRRAGEHRGGYAAFSIDITAFLQSGDNLISIRVNNEWSPKLQPRAGEHIFSGGLYRDVNLVTTDALHVTWNGISVTTPQVSRASGIVNINTEVRNASAETKTCSVSSLILDPEGKLVAQVHATRDIAPNHVVSFDQTTDPIANPQLWHPEHPHLYTVETEIHDGDTLVDKVVTPLGFRWFAWTPDRGFVLNGEHLYLRGANAHQDHSGWGVAITQAACWRDAKLMKDAGFNFIRGAHYPHHRALADACDRLGLIYWAENCFWGKGGFGPEGYWNSSAYPVNEADFEPFEAHCKQSLRELIRTHRNHPSIMVWSMTNEAFFTYNLDRAKRLMSDLVAVSHEEDPTRPAAIGGAQRGDVDKIGDIAGYNGDGARLFIDPGVPNMVSEYGAISKPPDAFDPFFGDLQRERYPWRAGEAIWAGFDYGSIAGRQGLKGIVDHARLPKRSWHWYRKEYLGIEPPPAPAPGMPRRLRLSAAGGRGSCRAEHPDNSGSAGASPSPDATIFGTDATDDCQLIVTVCDASGTQISNCPPVTLTIESGPGEFPTGRSITFDAETDIKIVEGQAAIAFRSYHGGKSVIRATSSGLEDATITITTIGDPQFVPGQTPIVAPRPYSPPAESETARVAMRNAVNVALNRPCRASSEAEGHPARNGNDGNDGSTWIAAAPTAGEWWTVDLEGFYQIASIRLVFGDAGHFRFVVDLSLDRQRWESVIDRRESTRTDAVRNDVFPPGATARYVRVTFTGVPRDVPASLRQIELYGILSVR